LRKEFEFDKGVAVGNANVTIVFSKGTPSPKTIGHISFHLPSMILLRRALGHLKKHKVTIEDPGNEIGPESPGSAHMVYGFTILTATVGNFLCKAESQAAPIIGRDVRDATEGPA
jgi:hypothetical protein